MGEGILGISAGGWLCMLGYTMLPLAWWWHHRGYDRWALAILLLCAGLLRLGPSLDPCLHEWDERYHALVAKHLLDDPFTPQLYTDPALPHDDANWTQARIWLHKPPLALWCIALSLKFFGLHPWAVRLPSILFSCLAVLLCHALARSMASSRVAFWSALLFAINGHLVELASGRTSTDHIDALLVVFVLAGVFASKRMAGDRSYIWAVVCGGCMGLAFLTKSWPALLIVPIALANLLAGPGQRPFASLALFSIVIFTGLVVAVPWQFHLYQAFPEAMAEASRSHLAHFGQAIEAHGRPWTYFWSQLPMIHGELAPLALIWFIAVPFRKRPREHAALLVWLLLPYIVFSFALTKMPGYTALAAPAMCMILAMAIEQWSLTRASSKVQRVTALVGSVGLVLLPVRFSVDRTRPLVFPEQRYPPPPHFLSGSTRTVVTECPFPIELMFHTRVAAAYAEDLSPGVKSELEAKGYRIVRFDER